MAGIVSYGAYVPLWRLSLAEMGRGRGEKAVGNFDEDSVTMGVAAAIDCLMGMERQRVDALFFATTTPPYVEKQSATIVAAAADLPRELVTADLSDSIKAGTTAVRMACDAVKGGSARAAMVVAADMRLASPGSAFETTYGDGAAALLIGDEGVVASMEGAHSVAAEICDQWRSQGEAYPRAGEDRFIVSQGYLKATREAILGLMERLSLQPGDFARVAVYGPDARSHAELVRGLDFDPKAQVEEPLFGKVGSAGAAHALMILVSVLEKAKPGDRILLAGYGSGADAISLQVTEEIEKLPGRRGMAKHLESRRSVDYQSYLNWRDILPRAGSAVRPVKAPSTTALWREQDEILRFHGCRCRGCGRVQYPRQRVCTYCHSKDQFDVAPLSDKGAEVFTYSMDYISGTKDVPMVVTVVNFEGGGRAMLQMTDRAIEELRVGMEVELSFRKLREVSGIHNYFWKTMPIRA